MYIFLGKLISRTWFLWLGIWLALLGSLFLTAPAWDDVAQDQEFAFLPADAPSRQGEVLFRQAFPNERQASSIVLVVRRPDQPLLPQDKAFIKDILKPALLHIRDQTSMVHQIRTLDDEGTGVLMVSEDGRATLVVMELTTELLDMHNWPIVANVEKLFAQFQQSGQVPAGIELSLTGGATVGRDVTVGQKHSSRATEFWTVLLVIALLAMIYRAPLLAAIPLLTLFVAIQVAIKILSHLADLGVVTLFEGIQIFITVILYGAGVDYCLFLIARYREELENGADIPEAISRAIGKVGAALTAGAATVTFGIGMMYFADFGKFKNAGIAIAFSLVIALVAVLTFSSALLRLTGRWAFWPTTLSVGAESSNARSARFSWQNLAQTLVQRPGLIWLTSILVLTPFAVAGFLYADHVDYDLIRRLPPDAPSVVATRTLQEHFPAGITGPVTVVLSHPQIDFRSDEGEKLLRKLTDRLKQQPELELADILSLAQPLGITRAAEAVTSGGAPFMRDTVQKLVRQRALEYYVSSAGVKAGHTTRLQLVMKDNPLSRVGIDRLNDIEAVIRDALPGALREQTRLFSIGTTASMRDLRTVTGHDQTRIEILVVASVLGILLVLLRRPIVSVYLVLSVLFSYFATLGVTVGVFWTVDGGDFAGLDWKTPLFLFTILVAVGEDYNIFLMSRVDEEQRGRDAVQGVAMAVVRTGRIITSCGIIMAGTFASLLAGSMQDMKHLGFALAFGVLVDTFVVRPILVPAFLILLARFRDKRERLAATPTACARS